MFMRLRGSCGASVAPLRIASIKVTVKNLLPEYFQIYDIYNIKTFFKY